jgi:hypothetical protein
MEVPMSSKQTIKPRPLFSDWPAWQTLPTQVQLQLVELLANMYREVLDASHENQLAEQLNDPPTD